MRRRGRIRRRSYARLFEGQVARHPERIAIEHADVRLTYGELNVRANRLAHHLRELGVSTGEPGRYLPAALDRFAGNTPGRAESGRGVRPARSRVSGGSAGLHVVRQRRARAGDWA